MTASPQSKHKDTLARALEYLEQAQARAEVFERENRLMQEMMELSEHEGRPAASVLRDKFSIMKRHRMEVPVPSHVVSDPNLPWRMARRYPKFTHRLLIAIRAGQL